MLPGEDIRKLYVGIQFLGLMLQMLPLLFLFFAPYERRDLKGNKRGILLFLSILTICVSAAGSLLMGWRYGETQGRGMQSLGNLIFALYLLAGTAIYFLVVKRQAGYRLLIYMLTLQYAVFVFSIVNALTKFYCLPLSGREFAPYTETGVMSYILIYLLTYVPAYYFLKSYCGKRIRRAGKKSMRLISVSAILIFLLYLVLLQGEMRLDVMHDDIKTRIWLNVWLVCLMIMDILVYYIYFRCIHIEEEKEEMSLRLAAEEMQFQSLQDKIREEERTYHNMRHHFRTLSGYLEEGRYQDSQDYLKKYLQEWEDISGKNICKNPMLNSILGYYVSLAGEREIPIHTDIQVKERYPIAATDMTVLLGNAMENAVEACLRQGVEDPFINLMIKQHRSTLLIQIENRCPPEAFPTTEKGRPGSAKKGRSRGYGLSSMEMIVEKYQGSLEYRAKDSIFTLRAVLNIPEEAPVREKTGEEPG